MKKPVNPSVFCLFLIGVFSGLVLGQVFPIFRESYISLYQADVQMHAISLGAKFGLVGILLAIFTRNFTLAASLILGPYIISYSCMKHGQDVKKPLALFTICSILAYGFFPYGLFIAHLYVRLQPVQFLTWISYFIPHGLLETIVILSAGSTGICLKEFISNGRDLQSLMRISSISKKLLFAGFSLLAIACIEVYVSPYFLAN